MSSDVMMLIHDGQVSSVSGEWLDVVNPATEQIEARVPHAGAEDVERAVSSAREAIDKGPWRRFAPAERGRLLLRLAELVEKNTESLALLDTQDMGKPFSHSRNHDLPGVVDLLRFYAGYSDKIRGSEVPLGPHKHVYVRREPVGVIAGILPWNFPLSAAVQKLAPAVACGNTVVLKAAEQSPRSAIRLAELCMEAGFPPGVVNALTGLGETTGSLLASHPAIDKVSFTGSTEAGRLVMKAAAENIHKVTLELGGKTANIVFPDAPVETAVSFALLTSCYNSGQVCTSGSRLLLHRGIHDEFMEKLVRSMNELKVGDPMQPDTRLGPLVSREQRQRVHDYVEWGKQHYTPTTCGYRSETLERGFFVNPTVFDHVDAESRIAQEEIFGPVLSVIDFEDEQEALRIANQTRYGLATAIWTNDLRRAHRMASRVDSGIVWVNCNNEWDPAIPYEGHRTSGVGADLGLEAVESYTRLKSVIVNLDDRPSSWAAAN